MQYAFAAPRMISARALQSQPPCSCAICSVCFFVCLFYLGLRHGTGEEADSGAHEGLHEVQHNHPLRLAARRRLDQGVRGRVDREPEPPGNPYSKRTINGRVPTFARTTATLLGPLHL